MEPINPPEDIMNANNPLATNRSGPQSGASQVASLRPTSSATKNSNRKQAKGSAQEINAAYRRACRTSNQLKAPLSKPAITK
jgi:hypothetical protein